MRRLIALSAALALSTALPAHAAPVEVTRFHTPETIVALGRGAVVVVPAPGEDGASLETRTWQDAVARELATLGFGAATPGAADALAEVRVERHTLHAERRRGPVSVGVGGSTGGWHSGVGLGVDFNLGGGPRDIVQTRLSVVIRNRATGKPLWEGRAENTEKASARAASADLAAARITHALFTGFPGTSGATITVK